MSAAALFLSGDAALLALAVAGALRARRPSRRTLVYGGALAISARHADRCARRSSSAARTASALVLPLGLPWIGAHFRVDALSAFFLVVVNLGARRGEPLRPRLRPDRALARAGAAVLPGLSRGHEPRPRRRRRLYVSSVLGVHVARLLGAGDGASSRGRQRARRLRLPRDGELRHARAVARLRLAGGPRRRLRLRRHARGEADARRRRPRLHAGPDRRGVEGGDRAAARLAAARPSCGAEPCLRADERGHDEGRRLRLRPDRV